MDVGVREFRNGLSRHLASVREGRTVSITDRGRVFARVVPVEQPTALQRLVEAGVVTPARTPKRPSEEPVAITGTVSDLVAEQRR